MYKKSDKVEIQVDGFAIYKGEIESVKEGYVYVRRTNLDGSMPILIEFKSDDPQLVLIEENPFENIVAPTPDPVVPETPVSSNEEPEKSEDFPAVEDPIEEIKDEPATAPNEEPA